MNHILQLLVTGFYCPQLNLSWRKTNEIISHPSTKGAGSPHWAGSTSPSCWESATAIGGTSGGDWTNWRMEICVANGLHWNHWSGNWSRSCWNFCWEIWKLLNGDPIFNLWSLYVFVQISCLNMQSFSEQKDLQNTWPMVALCAGWYGLRCPWWFLGRSQGGRRVVFFGFSGMVSGTLCQAVTDGHVVFLDDAIKKVPGIWPEELGQIDGFFGKLTWRISEDSWVFLAGYFESCYMRFYV